MSETQKTLKSYEKLKSDNKRKYIERCCNECTKTPAKKTWKMLLGGAWPESLLILNTEKVSSKDYACKH